MPRKKGGGRRPPKPPASTMFDLQLVPLTITLLPLLLVITGPPPFSVSGRPLAGAKFSAATDSAAAAVATAAAAAGNDGGLGAILIGVTPTTFRGGSSKEVTAGGKELGTSFGGRRIL